MAGLSEMSFLLGFLLCVAVFFAKLYNVFSIGEWYDKRFSWLGLAGFFLSYSLVFGTFLMNATDTTFLIVFRIASFLIVPVVVFHIVEMFFQYERGDNKDIEAHMSNKG